MKGLLLKDWYVLNKNCRSMFLIIVVFSICSAVTSNYFYVFYPILLASILPVTLISYDERAKWQRYAETMPYKRSEIVSGKYIMLLLVLAGTAVFMILTVFVASFFKKDVNMMESMKLITAIFFIGLAPSSIMLPVVFKFGVEKGRIAYYFLIGLVFAMAAILSTFMVKGESNITDILYLSNIWLPAAGIILFIISWFVSVQLYKKREL